MPMRMRSAYSSRVLRLHTSMPSNRTWPLSGLICPVISRSSVVLPVPLGPMMAVMRPRGIVRFRPEKIARPLIE